MCCFSRHVNLVTNTNIFARASAYGRQYLAYSMEYEADDELAMILPLPTPPASPEEAVRFIDLSGYPRFFDDLKLGFPVSRGGFQAQSLSLPLPASLKVHEVGSFEASFVPAQSDFARLDPRFRLPENARDKLPQYSDWGFAVFKLKAGAKDVHPMAFEFPRRRASELFFPTVHIHDGEVHPEAEFDHSLYCQIPKSPWGSHWRKSPGKAHEFMTVEKTQGLIDPETPVHVRAIHGLHKNEDVVLKL